MSDNTKSNSNVLVNKFNYVYCKNKHIFNEMKTILYIKTACTKYCLNFCYVDDKILKDFKSKGVGDYDDFLVIYTSQCDDWLIKSISEYVTKFTIIYYNKIISNEYLDFDSKKTIFNNKKDLDSNIAIKIKSKDDLKKWENSLPKINIKQDHSSLIDNLNIVERTWFINYNHNQDNKKIDYVNYIELLNNTKLEYDQLKIAKIDNLVKRFISKYSNKFSNLYFLDNKINNEFIYHNINYKIDNMKLDRLLKYTIIPKVPTSPIISLYPIFMKLDSNYKQLDISEWKKYIKDDNATYNLDYPADLNDSTKLGIARNKNLTLDEIYRANENRTFRYIHEDEIIEFVKPFNNSEEKIKVYYINDKNTTISLNINEYIKLYKEFLIAVINKEQKILDKFGVNLNHYKKEDIDSFINYIKTD